ncbi:MAG: sulfatase [Planctomycetota bacterium]
MISRVVLFAAALSLGVAGCGGDDAAPPPKPSPKARRVLLISCDTLRADRLGVYGYSRPTSPRLDEFARSAVVFDEAYATAPHTGPALSSLMTGRLPDELGVAGGNHYLMPEAAESLAELAQQAGWPTAAVVSNWVLRKPEASLGAVGLPQGFQHYDDRMTAAELNRTDNFDRLAPDTTDAALAWLEQRRAAAEDQFFLWVHYQDPHGPYTPPPEYHAHIAEGALHAALAAGTADEPTVAAGRTNKGKGQIPAYQVLGEERRPSVYRERYDAEIAFFDAALGSLLDWLEQAGWLDEALVIFTADHGESLGEHGYWFCHGENLHREVVRVPLIVRFPRPLGAEGAPNLSAATPLAGRRPLASHLDLFPTVLEAFGLPARATAGRSLFGADESAPRALVHTLGKPGTKRRWEGLSDGRYRLLMEAQIPRLYDLVADPEELRDIAGSEPERVRAMGKTLRQTLASLRPIATQLSVRQLSEQDTEAFNALGYTGGGDAEDEDGDH